MLSILLRIALLLACLGLFPGTVAAEEKLNVLFLMSDDMRPDLGCYGHTIVQSPNLDALAKAGVRFERAYCQYPLCNPSRTSLLTGRYPTTSGVLDNRIWFKEKHPDIVSLPAHFKTNGYATLRSGKIFHGGIDDTDAWTEGGEPRVERKGANPGYAMQSDRIVVLEGDGEKHNDYRTADRAIAYLKKYKDRPFFLACGFIKPHSPPTAPKKFIDRYDVDKIPLPDDFAPRPTVPDGFPKLCLTPNGDLFIKRDASKEQAREMIRAYWASISWVDWNIGRVLAELDRLKLRDKTLIVFWGDHGYHLGEKGKWSKHGSLFEVGTRVPLIVLRPGAKGNGQSSPRPVQSLDLYPTLCELCGVNAPKGLEGTSLRPLLDDPNTKWYHPAFSVFRGGKSLGVAVRTGRYRYVEYDAGKAGAMLFDHQSDPYESKNLATDESLAEVRKRLATLTRKLSAKE
jgi:arylsulfatase A-like enzyme